SRYWYTSPPAWTTTRGCCRSSASCAAPLSIDDLGRPKRQSVTRVRHDAVRHDTRLQRLQTITESRRGERILRKRADVLAGRLATGRRRLHAGRERRSHARPHGWLSGRRGARHREHGKNGYTHRDADTSNGSGH